ncbi:MAG: SPOR domain-containing protein [Pseudomonadota bacterium]
MARDYKNSGAKKKAQREKPMGSWMSFVSGLSLGLLVAFLVYLWRDQVPAVDGGRIANQVEEFIFEKDPENTEISDIAIDDTPTPKFDFYNILPEVEVKVPDWQLEANDTGDSGDLQPGTYVLQVGSFRELKDADRAKAQLALSGMHAKIHRVVINGQDVWYRVHLGPFEDSETIQAARRKLIESKNDFIVIRMGNS